MKIPVPVTGVWLRATTSGQLTVLVEVGGVWRQVIDDVCDGPISHIVETPGILAAPVDDLPEVPA